MHCLHEGGELHDGQPVLVGGGAKAATQGVNQQLDSALHGLEVIVADGTRGVEDEEQVSWLALGRPDEVVVEVVGHGLDVVHDEVSVFGCERQLAIKHVEVGIED